MFKLNLNAIESELPLIVDNYKDLLYDETPILYLGTNHFGNRIIGSLVDEDILERFTRHLHSIIDEKLYYNFINKEITYLNLLERSKEKYFIDETFDGNKFIFPISFKDIPQKYLPDENSFCPEIEHDYTFNYGISLKGKIADEHKGEVSEINSVQINIEQILKSTLFALEELNLEPKTLLEPATTGSFRINFTIELKNNNGFFSIKKAKISNYISSYLDYILLKLPNEKDNALKIFPEKLESVKKALNSIYEESNVPIADLILEEKILENLNVTAKKVIDLTSNINNSNSFNRIEVFNYGNDGYEHGMGKIDNNYIQSIESKIIKDIPLLEINTTQTDTEPQNYRILIYKLSSESGKGMARIYHADSEDFDRAYLHIKSDKEIQNSHYSNSFHEGKVIDVKGIGTKKDGIYRRLIIDVNSLK